MSTEKPTKFQKQLARWMVQQEARTDAIARARQVAVSSLDVTTIDVETGEDYDVTLLLPEAIQQGVRAAPIADQAGLDAAEAAQAAAEAANAAIAAMLAADSATDLASDAMTRASGSGRLRHEYAPPTNPVDPAEFSEGDLWFEHNPDRSTRMIWTVSDGEWVEAKMDGSMLQNIDLGTATVGFLSGGRLEANSVGIEHLIEGIGAELNLSGNEAINLIAGRIEATESTLEEQGRYLRLDGDGLTLGVPTPEGETVGAQLHMDVNQITMLQGGTAVSWWGQGVMHVTRAEVAVINIGKHQFEQDGTSRTIIRAL